MLTQHDHQKLKQAVLANQKYLVHSFLNDHPHIAKTLFGELKQNLLFYVARISNDNDALEMLQLLLKFNINPNATDTNQQTPLFYMAVEGKYQCIEQLIKHGVQIDFLDGFNQNAIFFTSKNNQLDCAKLLIKHGCNINQLDKNNENVLCYAARHGNFQMCKLLVQKGALISLRGRHDAIYYAKSQKHHEIVKYLNSCKKKGNIPKPQQQEKDKVRKKVKIQQECTKIRIDLNSFDIKKQIKQQIEQKDGKEEVKVQFHRFDRQQYRLPSKKPIKQQIKRKKNIDSNLKSYKLIYTDQSGNPSQIVLPDLLRQIPKNSILANFLTQREIPNNLNQIIKNSWRKKAMKITNQIWVLDSEGYFHKPVNPIQLRIHNYFNFIQQPMDLSTVKKKLITNVYRDADEFIKDVNLIFDNCIKYNGGGSIFGRTAVKCKQQFSKLVLQNTMNGQMNKESKECQGQEIESDKAQDRQGIGSQDCMQEWGGIEIN